RDLQGDAGADQLPVDASLVVGEQPGDPDEHGQAKQAEANPRQHFHRDPDPHATAAGARRRGSVVQGGRAGNRNSGVAGDDPVAAGSLGGLQPTGGAAEQARGAGGVLGAGGQAGAA